MSSHPLRKRRAYQGLSGWYGSNQEGNEGNFLYPFSTHSFCICFTFFFIFFHNPVPHVIDIAGEQRGRFRWWGGRRWHWAPVGDGSRKRETSAGGCQTRDSKKNAVLLCWLFFLTAIILHNNLSTPCWPKNDHLDPVGLGGNATEQAARPVNRDRRNGVCVERVLWWGHCRYQGGPVWGSFLYNTIWNNIATRNKQ